MRALITGSEGFVGSHLADLLVEKKYEVFGTVHSSTENIKHLIYVDGFTPIVCDLTNRVQANKAVEQAKPDVVFHLAAQSYLTVSWNDPINTLKTNIMGTFNILDALREQAPQCKIILTSSSAVYGVQKFLLHKAIRDKIVESDRRSATSFYAASKIAVEEIAKVFRKAYGMDIITVRPFNMTGPRKVDDACSDFVRQIVDMEKSDHYVDSLNVGNLSTIRDITDGRDAAQALLLLSQKNSQFNIFNLCSGRGWKMLDVLQMILKLSGHEDLRYTQVPEKMRPTDDPIFIGDNSRLRFLGWEPKIALEQTLRDMLDYWRNRA